MKKTNIQDIPQDKFRLVQDDRPIYDAKIETKSISYFGDAMRRFSRNKASVAGAIIIMLVVIFSVTAPFISPYKVSDVDGTYAKARPKLKLFEGTGFWDGHKTLRANDKYLIYLNGIGMAAADHKAEGVDWQAGKDSAYSVVNSMTNPYFVSNKRYREVQVDSYYLEGFKYVNITEDQYEDLKAWEDKEGLPVIYPMIDKSKSPLSENDANYWFKMTNNGGALNKAGKNMELEDVIAEGLVDNYLRDADGNVQYFTQRGGTMREVRVLNYNYYIYKNGHEPLHYLGSDVQGYDIFVRVAQGTRLSIVLAVLVSFVNLTIGAFYGAIQGYYGGAVDLIMDRITDVISGMPFVVIATLFQLHLVMPGKVSAFEGILFAFFISGWIATASRVRTQFYRFKNEEYILSARSMGAGDARLMLRHIFPNAIGTIITSSVLVIPGTILSESSLSYIGVINFNSKEMTSLGTMLSNGQGYLASDPHILFVPAIIISLLMISFNLFGNGLRDAFNPALRGSEE